MDYEAAAFWEHREQFHWNTQSIRYRCSFCSTLSSEQLWWSIMESESTYGSSARSTYNRDHSVNMYSCSTGAHGSSSCFPGVHRAALLEHVEQQLYRSRYRCFTRAHGAVAFREHREQLCWSTWSSGSLRADTGYSCSTGAHGAVQWLSWRTLRTESSSAGARGAAALWEQIRVFLGAAAFPEHTEQLCWYTCSSGATLSAAREPRCSTC